MTTVPRLTQALSCFQLTDKSIFMTVEYGMADQENMEIQ